MKTFFPLKISTISFSLFALLSGGFLALSAPAQSAVTDPVSNSLVRIHAVIQTPDYRVPWNPGRISGALGSGFVISGKRILTNAHVVSNARFLAVEKNGDPRRYPARVLFLAHDCDLALLTVDDPKFFTGMPPLEFGGIPRLHSSVFAYGYPIGGARMSVTRGIVSRIEFRPYAHSYLDSHLTIQIDAAINPGNSGGPVIQNNKVIGVAFQGFSGMVAQNTGYMIPTPVINRFLQDITDQHYDGYAELAVNYLNLRNPAYRAKLGLSDKESGVVVQHVLSAGSAAGIILPGDILLRIDHHPITNDGHITLDGEYVQMEEVVERKFKGDTVNFAIIRQGKQQSVNVTLKGAWPYRILANQYNVRPRFILFAGLLFQPMDRNFLAANRVTNPDALYYYNAFLRDEIYLRRPELVILSTILSDPINTYLRRFRMNLVDEVNGKKITTLRDLAVALSTPAKRYVIRMIGNGVPIILEADKISAANKRIRQRYAIPEEKYLGTAPGPVNENHQ